MSAITLTDSVFRLIETYRRRAPGFDWCVVIGWAPSSADNYRLADGEQTWVLGIPDGWVAMIVPCTEGLVRGAIDSECNGIGIYLDQTNAPAGFPFRGRVIDTDGRSLSIAP